MLDDNLETVRQDKETTHKNLKMRSVIIFTLLLEKITKTVYNSLMKYV